MLPRLPALVQPLDLRVPHGLVALFQRGDHSVRQLVDAVRVPFPNFLFEIIHLFFPCHDLLGGHLVLPANHFQPGQFFLQTDLVQVPPVLDAVVVRLQGFLACFLGLLLRVVGLAAASAAAAPAAAAGKVHPGGQQSRLRLPGHGDNGLQRGNGGAVVHVDVALHDEALPGRLRPADDAAQVAGHAGRGSVHALICGGDGVVQSLEVLPQRRRGDPRGLALSAQLLRHPVVLRAVLLAALQLGGQLLHLLDGRFLPA